MILPPIPDLVKDGVTLSSINLLPAPDSIQFHIALRKFVPRSRNLEEDARYLNASLQLYVAFSLACWSIGGKEFTAYRQLLKSSSALLEILIARMDRDIDPKKIEHSLEKLLDSCGACSPQDKYEAILLAGTAGVDPNKYIPKVKGLECKDLRECIQITADEQIFLRNTQFGSALHSRRGFLSWFTPTFLLIFTFLLLHLF
ncbi:hypothetical protein DFH28DRAFT_1123327 [Melampsora americana]|nr:hypothetical protein DFH28DRAFT_1125811 [Melampsora americana]KAH9818220.1 hypothetical protein DFH28DRAFT_1123327 [Melampsora americana]